MSDDLQEQLALDRAAGRPTLLRLLGPGARQAAAAVAAVREQATLGALPSEGDVLWLDEGPGVRAHADVVVASFALRPRPGTLLLTGSACDGGHPEMMETLHVAAAPPGTGHPTQVQLPELPDAAEALAEEVQWLEDGGEFTRAHAAWEALLARAPERAAPLRWIDVRRLNTSGRSAEVMQRAKTGLGPMDHREELLFQVAVAAHSSCQANRAETLLRLLASSAMSERLRADAQSLLDELLLDDEQEHALPLRPHALSGHMAVLRRAGHDVPRHEVPTRFQQLSNALELNREDAGIAGLALELGVFRRAARLHRQTAPTRAVLAYADQLDRRIELDCRRALECGDLRGARDHLERLPRAAQNWTYTFRAMATNRALLAAWDDDVTQLQHLLRERFARTIGLHRDRSRELERLLARTEGAPDHARAVVLQAVATHGGAELQSRAQAALENMPHRPIFLGPYVLEAPIGKGGMAEVWRGRHSAAPQGVAVKVVRKAREATWSESFRHEIELTTRLEHPAIVGVLDFGTINAGAARQSGGRLMEGMPYLVMELVEGGTLADHVGLLSVGEVKDIALALLDALAYAHSRGVVHRDLKPANVLVTEDAQIRLADFGIAGVEGLAAGTPAYMAPEQFHGVTDPRTDLYGLGCMLWHLLTRSPPFSGGSTELAKAHVTDPLPPLTGVPLSFARWLQTCLAKQPADRFPSAFAARQALEGQRIPISAPTRGPAAAAAPTTFMLDTLLDLPPLAAPPDLQVAVDDRTSLRPPRPRAAFRARPPTTNLQDRGDPPLIGQSEARHALREAFERVLTTRRPVQLTLQGELGYGRHALIRSLRNEAREQGFVVGDLARPGLAVIDATGTDRDAWADALASEPPWLVVHTERPGAGATLPLRPLVPLELFFTARSRLPLDPATAVDAGARAAGRPGLLLRILEAWRSQPGFQVSPSGLTLRGPPPRVPTEVRAFWQQALDEASPATRTAVSVAAHLQAGFHMASFRRVCQALGSPDLDLPIAWLEGPYGRWSVPPELRWMVLQERRDAHPIHQAAANVQHTEWEGRQRQVWHAILAGDTEQMPDLVRALRATTLRPYSPRLSAPSRDAIRLATELSLGLGPIDIAWLDLVRARALAPTRPQQAVRLARRAAEVAAAEKASGGLLAAAWATVARGEDPGPPKEALASLDRIPDLGERAWLTAMLGPALRWAGHIDAAEHTQERVLAWAEELPDGADLRAAIALDRSFPAPVSEIAAVLGPAFLAADPTLRAVAYQNLSHAHLALDEPQEALRAAEQADALVPGDPYTHINLASAATLCGERERALEAALHSTRSAYLEGLRNVAVVAHVLSASLSGEWPEARWRDFVASIGPIEPSQRRLMSDTSVADAVQHGVNSLPPARAATLRALLS